MLLNYKTIDLFGKTLFTWVRLEQSIEEQIPMPENEACFAYIQQGNYKVQNSNEVIDVAPGKAILSRCSHYVAETVSAHGNGGVTSVIIHLHRDVLMKVSANARPSFIRELEKPAIHFTTQFAASELVKRYFEGIMYLFEHQEAVMEEILVLKLKEIMLLLAQTKDSPQVTEILSSIFSTRSFSFKEIVEANICSGASVEQLALLTNHSLSSFKREFKKHYGSSPNAYLIDRRAEKVAKLLQLSEESVSSIGYECGFNSPAHLSRVFRQKYGMSPKEYRMSFSVKELDL